MKRMYYVSRFSRRLSKADLADIHDTALRNNRRAKITGFLVCLGDTFFQVLEGPVAMIDRLYYDRIVPDDRHKDVVCLKSENGVKKRMFPEWNMKVFNLNEGEEDLPFAFREMLTALLDSHNMIAHYTQPSVFGMLERGVNPILVQPRRKRVTVLYSDIIGFSIFAEHLAPRNLLDLVNSHIEVCVRHVTANSGEVNKLTGDGVLAYFAGATSDAALECALEIVKEMADRRSKARKNSPQRLLHGGVGLAHGFVFEGNVGLGLKRDFTILGNTVNIAARLESMTRDHNVRLTLDASVARRARRSWEFVSLGKHKLKGQSHRADVLTLGSLSSLDVKELYGAIQRQVERQKR